MHGENIKILLNLVLNLLFHPLIFANARFCCYLVILNKDYILRRGDYKSFRVTSFVVQMTVVFMR